MVSVNKFDLYLTNILLSRYHSVLSKLINVFASLYDIDHNTIITIKTLMIQSFVSYALIQFRGQN